jgi:carbon monoxide dehydrogenase subunit G
MKIDNEFNVSVPIDLAWEALTDLEEVSLCLPGARLTGIEGDVYSGEVKVKVGPVISQYAGTAQFAELDDANHRAVIDAKGKDSRGAGNASALITMQLQADGLRTVVTVNTDLKISGKIAQLGGGMIAEVSQKLLGQFVDCLESKLTAPATSEETSATAPSEVAAAATSAGDPQPVEAVSAHQGDPRSGGSQPAREESPISRAASPDPEPLDLMSLAGGSMAKRLVPLVVVALIVVAVVVYLVAR